MAYEAAGPVVRLNDMQAALYVATYLLKGTDYKADFEEIKVTARVKFGPSLSDVDLFSLSHSVAELIQSTR